MNDKKPVSEYQQAAETNEILRDIGTAMKQIEAGEAVSSADAKAELRRRLQHFEGDRPRT